MSNLIQKGRHQAVCRSIQLALAGEGENEKEQIVIGFEFVGEGDPDVGRFHSGFFFFTDKTWERTIEALRHMGWQGDDIHELPQLAESGALSEVVELVIDHEEYNGEWQAKIKWVNKLGGGMVKVKKPLEGRQLASFSALMKSKIRTMGDAPKRPQNGAGGSRQQQPHPNAPGNRMDDDIPFASCELSAEPSPIARVIR